MMAPLIGFLVAWIVASVGHAALLVHTVNCLHCLKTRAWWIKLFRRFLHVLNAGLPLWFAWHYGPRLATEGGWLDLPWPLLAYLCLCWAVGGGYFPYMLLRRHTRRPPSLQTAHSLAHVDVAKQLGHIPRGKGKHGLVSYLPFNEVFQVEFVQRELRLPRLPDAWDGLTLLHLSDLHLCGAPDRDYFEWVIDHASQERADLVCITGDILDSPQHYDWIRPVLGRLQWRHGGYAILGNHDSYLDVPIIERELQGLDLQLLGGKWLTTTIRGEPLVIVGNERPWLHDPPELRDGPPDVFRLALCHTPDEYPWAKANGIDLMLAGHNHGGQIRIPGLGPIFVPSRYSGRYDAGLFYEPPTLLHVSRGLSGTYPIRYRCRPEITRLVLRPMKLHDDPASARPLMDGRPKALSMPS